ncbi:hypothetical protein CYMTET_27496 [Cymbomonas tetramitiformis]|uniref:Uncharacterized protein n=1 Tax=Cymbomonas tetramitiformis TaxID=36881 RepID=A0AAE0FPQ1_9CHLO|nr:hypothetical protein CYMTET_27496 [Cymbomonas tetramitiformis]
MTRPTGLFRLQHFFSSNLDPQLQKNLDELPDSFVSRHCLVSGPARSGKTSILFQLAYNCAAQGQRVLFICKRQKIETVPPLPPAGVTPSACSHIYTNIDMRYLESDAELRKYFASFHLLPRFPHLVIVDDFSDIVEGRSSGDRRVQEYAFVRTLALAHDTVNFASQKLSPQACRLVVSDTGGDNGPKYLFLYQRWLRLAFGITVADRSFLFSVLESEKSAGAANSIVRYTISNFLSVEGIETRLH